MRKTNGRIAGPIGTDIQANTNNVVLSIFRTDRTLFFDGSPPIFRFNRTAFLDLVFVDCIIVES